MSFGPTSASFNASATIFHGVGAQPEIFFVPFVLFVIVSNKAPSGL